MINDTLAKKIQRSKQAKESDKKSFDLTNRKRFYSQIETGEYDATISAVSVEGSKPTKIRVDLEVGDNTFFFTTFNPDNMVYAEAWDSFFDKYNITNIKQLIGMNVCFRIENNTFRGTTFANVVEIDKKEA